MTPRTKDILSAFFWLFFAAYVAIESCRMGLGKWSRPGPGYFPLGAALLFGLISILLLSKSLRKASVEKVPTAPSEGRWRDVVLNLMAMVVYVFLLDKIGFILCTFLLATFFLRVIAQQRWFAILISALSITIGAHLLFNVLLNAKLPSGILPFFGG